MTKLHEPIRDDDHILGKFDAPCVLVEYGDYESSPCLYARHIVKELLKHFETEVAFVFRHFPTTSAQSYAEMAAETSEFAATHGMFWEMHDLLYQSQERNANPVFQEIAEALGLDGIALLRDLELQTFEPRVSTDVRGGRRSGVTSAPAFFIQNQRYHGPIESADMSKAIRSALLKERSR